MAKVESSEDSEQTLIFSRPKPNTPSKLTVSKKGTAHKIIPRKETSTLTVGPSYKGKGKNTCLLMNKCMMSQKVSSRRK